MLKNLAVLARKGLMGKPLISLVILVSVLLSSYTAYLAMAITSGLGNTLNIVRQRSGADLFVLPAGSKRLAEDCLLLGLPATFYLDARIEEKVARLPGVMATSPQVFLEYIDSGQNIPAMPIIGYRPATDFAVAPWLAVHKEISMTRSSLIMGAKLAREISITDLPREGSIQTFYGMPFKVAGVLEPSGTGFDAAVFMPMDTAYKIVRESPLYPAKFSPDMVSIVAVKTHPGVNPDAMAAEILAAIPGVEVMPGLDVNRTLTQRLYQMAGILYLGAAQVGIITLALAGTLFHFLLKHRRREMGVLQALGASGRALTGLLMWEVLLLLGLGSCMGVSMGLLFTTVGRPWTEKLTGTMFAWPDGLTLAGLAFVTWLGYILTGVAGGLLLTRSLRRIDPFFHLQRMD